MNPSRRSQIRRSTRLIAISTLAATLAVACGGGGDDDDADEPDVTEEVTGGDPTGGEDTGADDTQAPETDEGEDTAPVETDAPVVETLPPETALDPVAGGTLRYGLDADVDGLNPAVSALSAPGLTMANAVFDTLAAIAPDDSTVPYLAESFTPNDDFTQWTMKVREGISFHDGTPFNADAVIANFEAQRQSGLVGLAVRPFYPETDAITKVDEYTVTYNLLDSNAYFPSQLATQIGLVASPAWLEAAAADPSLNQAPVGTGPFVFDVRSPDSVTRMVRNDNWWNGEVYLDAIEFYPTPDAATRVDLLLGDELDGMMTNDPESIIVIDDEGDFLTVKDETGEEQFAMLNTEKAPFDDIRARQALANATPIQDYMDLIGLGISTPAHGRFIATSPYHNPDIRQVSDNPDAAVQLASEYCAERGNEENPVLGGPTCTDGKINIELQFSGPSLIQTRIHELLAESWGVAFNVTFNELLEQAHIQETATGNYNVNTWRQFGEADPSVDNVWLLCRTVGGISLNWPRFCDEQRDALLLQAQSTTDPAERATLYQQVEQMINDSYAYIFLRHTLWDNAFNPRVHGICDRVSPEGDPLKCAQQGRVWFSSIWME